MEFFNADSILALACGLAAYAIVHWGGKWWAGFVSYRAARQAIDHAVEAIAERFKQQYGSTVAEHLVAEMMEEIDQQDCETFDIAEIYRAERLVEHRWLATYNEHKDATNNDEGLEFDAAGTQPRS